MKKISPIVLVWLVCGLGLAKADTKIAVWNIKATLEEASLRRANDFAGFASEISPDVIVLVETSGERNVQYFVDQLDWDEVYHVTSNFSELATNVFYALEVAVVSRLPVQQVIEYDASPDGAHAVRNKFGDLIFTVQERKLSSDGASQFANPLERHDRGTLRVDLRNGLSIFPVHLKSDRVDQCEQPKAALSTIKNNKFQLSQTLQQQLQDARSLGFAGATRQRLTNAQKRERIIAAVARAAYEAIDQARHVIIAGDFNTAFELGKTGNVAEDCTLKNFSCKPAPFPAWACSDGDGYDDTFAILERGYALPTSAAPIKWTILTKRLGRTYRNTAFADAAIDHIAVPLRSKAKFSAATKHSKFFGSDHLPVLVDFLED